MKNILKISFFMLASVTVVYVINAKIKSLDLVDQLPIYDEAYNVDKRRLGNKLSQQLSFFVTKDYPSVDVLSFYSNYFVKSGWEKCRGNIEEWDSYVDLTDEPERLVHRVVHYFVKEDESILSLVQLEYRSESISEDKPDNNMQVVIIPMYRESNLSGTMQELSINCGKHNT